MLLAIFERFGDTNAQVVRTQAEADLNCGSIRVELASIAYDGRNT